MTKNEILEYFKDINHAYNDCTRYDTLKRMLDELEQEPCEDAISRQAVIDAIITLWADKPFGNPALTEIKECVERVPSANPQRTGHWIIPKDIMWENPKCAECGFESADHDNYCPHCGIRMVEPQERSGEE